MANSSTTRFLPIPSAEWQCQALGERLLLAGDIKGIEFIRSVLMERPEGERFLLDAFDEAILDLSDAHGCTL